MVSVTASDLRALAQLVDDRKVVVVRHENLLAVLKPDVVSHPSPPPTSSSSLKDRC